MFGRLLVAVSQVDADRCAIEATASLARTSGAVSRVLHVREGDCTHGYRYLETRAEAWEVVDEAVFNLRMAGIGSSGQVRRARVGRVGDAILTEAREWQADAIVLGPGRSTLLSRWPLGRTVTSYLKRLSPVPIVNVPSGLVPSDIAEAASQLIARIEQ